MFSVSSTLIAQRVGAGGLAILFGVTLDLPLAVAAVVGARHQARVDTARSRRRKRLRGGGRQRGIAVIDGGCPCMFDPTADLGHKAMRVVFTLTGTVPKEV
jgi:hypothetical protein